MKWDSWERRKRVQRSSCHRFTLLAISLEVKVGQGRKCSGIFYACKEISHGLCFFMVVSLLTCWKCSNLKMDSKMKSNMAQKSFGVSAEDDFYDSISLILFLEVSFCL